MLHPIIADPSVTKHILRRFKLRAVKNFGQNFLIDPQIVRKIVDSTIFVRRLNAYGVTRAEFTEALACCTR